MLRESQVEKFRARDDFHGGRRRQGWQKHVKMFTGTRDGEGQRIAAVLAVDSSRGTVRRR